MHVSAFAFGALQVLIVAASALPANLTGRDDYYGDARRDHLPTVTTPLTSGLTCRPLITLLEQVPAGTPTTTVSPL